MRSIRASLIIRNTEGLPIEISVAKPVYFGNILERFLLHLCDACRVGDVIHGAEIEDNGVAKEGERVFLNESLEDIHRILHLAQMHCTHGQVICSRREVRII